jgi:hypothetical protein
MMAAAFSSKILVTSTRIHDIKFRKTVIIKEIAVRTSNFE